MRKATRAALAIGLGLVGVAGIVVPSIGQDAPGQGSRSGRRAQERRSGRDRHN